MLNTYLPTIFLDKLKGYLNRKGAAKDVATLSLGTVLAQFIIVVATPLLSRLYTPKEFGMVAVFIAVSAVVATFVTLRYEVNILVSKTCSESKQLVLLSFALAVCLSLVVSVVAFVLPDVVRDSLGVGVLQTWFPWACLMGLTTAVSAIAFGWLNRSQLYKKIAKLRIAQSFFFVGTSILLGFWSFKDGLLVAQMGSMFLVMLLVARYLPIESPINISTISSVAYKYRSTPMYTLPTALLDIITLQLPVILIGAWYGSSEAGQFSLAWRVLVMPASVVGVAIGQVFFQRFAAAWPDANTAWSLLVRTWKILALVGLLPLIALLLFGEKLFSVIFGSNWAQSGKMAVVLAPMLFASLLHSPTSTTSIVLGTQKHILLLAVIVLIYRPLSLYIGWVLGDIYVGLAIYSVLEIAQILVFQYWIYKKIKLTMSS